MAKRENSTNAPIIGDQRFATLVNQAVVGVVQADAEGRMTFVNPRWCDMLGYSEAELLGMSIADVIHPESAESTRTAIHRLAEGAGDFEIEKRYCRKDGSVLWANSSIGALRSEEGKYLGLVAMVLDITDHKRREANAAFLNEISQDLARLTDIGSAMNTVGKKIGAHLGLSACAFVELDEAVEIGVINHGWHRSDIPSLIGTYRMDEFVTPEVLKRCRTGEAVIIRDVFADPMTDGEQFAALNIGSGVSMPLVRDDKWRFLLVVYHSESHDWRSDEIKLIRELTARIWTRLERARAEEALRESKERYRTLFDAMDEGYCVIEVLFDERQQPVDYRFIEVNGSFERQAGMQDVVGKRMLEFVPVIESHWLHNYGHVALTGEGIRFADEYKALHRWFDVYAFRASGWPKHHVAVLFKDITERKLADIALREANRHKDEFLATLGHELRNPLAPLRTGLEVMRVVGDKPEELEQIRTTMERQVNQLVRLVDDLLDVSRITQGRIELRKETVDLVDLVRDAVEATREMIENAEHALTVTLPQEPVNTEADPARLTQVFANLLDNAAKYTPAGGHIEIALVREDAEATVTVRDDGTGIEPEKLDEIFSMFRQVEPFRTHSQDGLGVGLTLVKQLTALHGGTVAAHSEGLDQGAVFTVRLPLSTVSETQKPTAAEPAAVALLPQRILIVDDNQDAAKSLAMLLETNAANKIRVAHDGLQGLEAAETFRPDIVFLDIGMPRLDGIETAKRLRAEPWGQNITLVALSGWGQPEDKRRTQEAGFDHHLVKPIDLAKLQAILASGKLNEH